MARSATRTTGGRAKPTLSAGERRRRGAQAKKELVPAAIKTAGKKGFAATKEALEGKPGIESPEKLAGWLKGQAKAKGQLSAEHPYVGRQGFRRYPKQAASMTPKAYARYLRKARGG